MMTSLHIVILGLSLTSSWGNGHATTFRGLVRELTGRGHDVLFLERDVPWYAENRDLPDPPWGRTELYQSLSDLKTRFGRDVRDADFVMVGSYVPEGIAVGSWVTETTRGVTAFYDIDTPVTLAKLKDGGIDYITPDLMRAYDLYLSFAGGPALTVLEQTYGARRALPLYCSVDTALYGPQEAKTQWDLGYMGTYSTDRQPALDRLLLEPAQGWQSGRFIVAGPQYPPEMAWPENVLRIEHLPPAEHRTFYNAQRFTLNVTRADMIALGYSPSVRLFEAAACGTPIISDYWEGLESFFSLGTEILVAAASDDVLRFLTETPESERRAIGAAARARVLTQHTAARRAAELEQYALQTLSEKRTAR